MKYTIDTNTNITDIINKLKDNDELFFKRGKYHLKLSLKQNNLKITGEGMFNTIIYNDDHYHKIMSDYNECNTFRTYTLEILGDNCTIEDICITNICDSKTYGQAVALNVYGNNFLANNIMLKSEQDTLFTGPLPADLVLRYKDFLPDLTYKNKPSKQTYLNSIIIGDVDFIFGGATALFENCQIIMLNNRGYVAAPSHANELKYGYLFNECNFIAVNNDSNFYLARPWRDYGLAYFINSNYSPNILEEGFNKWNDTNRDKTCRFYEYNKLDYNRIYFLNKLTKEDAISYVKEFKKYLKETT